MYVPRLATTGNLVVASELNAESVSWTSQTPSQGVTMNHKATTTQITASTSLADLGSYSEAKDLCSSRDVHQGTQTLLIT